MTQTAVRYQAILEQARRLPPAIRRQLAESLLRPTNGDDQTVLVSVRRLLPNTQARFQELMDRHNSGALNEAELRELKGLVARYEALMLHNSEALLKAARPDLFTPSGRLRRKRLEQALRRKTKIKRSTTSNK